MLKLWRQLQLNTQTKIWISVYLFSLGLFAIWSYGLTAPNLILFQHPSFIQFQTWMWQTFFNNRILLVRSYAALIGLIVIAYLMLSSKLSQVVSEKTTDSQLKTVFLLFKLSLWLALPLMLAYNALSFDVFNYIFNAKIVLQYQANPHIKTALDFSFDPWVRFMHNIHTPAPYGYGWTWLSLIPYQVFAFLSQTRFSLIWLGFTVFSFLSLAISYQLLVWLRTRDPYSPSVIDSKSLKSWIWLLLNPLLLIEIVANSHNDLWMIIPALISFGLIIKPLSKSINSNQPGLIKLCKRIGVILTAVSLFLFSISIKYATIVLIPIWGVFLIRSIWPIGLKQIVKKLKLSLLLTWFNHHWPWLASALLFLPLFTNRSQQFHPWYLIWSLVWLPLIKVKWWRQLLIILSLSSLARYLPWLLANNYTPAVLLQQKLITWVPAVLFLLYLLLFKFKQTKTELLQLESARGDH